MPRSRALVVYESMFGNTKAVAETIADSLSARYDVDVREVSAAPAAPAGYALVVVGGPIHAFGMTRPSTRADAQGQAEKKHVAPVSTGIGVREWLEQLPAPSAPTSAAAFDTAARVWGFTVGSAARGEAKSLQRHGYAVVAPPEHFYVRDVDGPLLDGELERARTWAGSLTEA